MTNPSEAPIYALDELLAQMTTETFHEEVDFVSPIGNEHDWVDVPRDQIATATDATHGRIIG